MATVVCFRNRVTSRALWYSKIKSFLVGMLGYKIFPYEPLFYLNHEKENVSIIFLYVLDLLIAGKNRREMESIKTEFKNLFKMKYLGNAIEFLD